MSCNSCCPSLEEMFNMDGEGLKCGGLKNEIQTAGSKIIQNSGESRISSTDTTWSIRYAETYYPCLQSKYIWKKRIKNFLGVQIKWTTLQASSSKNGPTLSCHLGIIVPLSQLESTNAALQPAENTQVKKKKITLKQASTRTRSDGRKHLGTLLLERRMADKDCSFWLHPMLQQNLTFSISRTNMVYFFFFLVFICLL